MFGIQTVDMGVFGGILLGLVCGWVYNRTCEKPVSYTHLLFWGKLWPFGLRQGRVISKPSVWSLWFKVVAATLPVLVKMCIRDSPHPVPHRDHGEL